MKDKTIICIPNVDINYLKKIRDLFKEQECSNIFVNQNCKMFKIKDGELFEVVSDLKQVKNIEKLIKEAKQ